jgi:polyferredoxin
VLFVPLVFVIGKSIYDYFNPFEALHWGFELWGTATLLIVLVAAFFIFRPFCYLLCPIGLITWLLEHISLSRVEVDPDKCTECYECTDVAPCPAMIYIVDGKRFRPDCHACGRCLNTCDEDAIKFVGRGLFNRKSTKKVA